MKCAVCTDAGADRDAVGICPNCGVALCGEHREERPVGPAGTTIGCRHRAVGGARSAA